MKKILWCGICIFLAVLVCFRWIQLNDKNYQGFDAVTGDHSVVADGLRYSIVNSGIYEMPAFVETHPELEEFYAYETNHYVKMGMEEAYKTLKYVVYVELKVLNQSKKQKLVTYSDYELTCENQTISQGVYPELTGAVNDGAIDKKLNPGEYTIIKLSYDLIGANIKDLSYQKLKRMKLMIPVSGYPKLQAILIRGDHLIKSDGSFDPYKEEEVQNVVNDKNIPKDTETGSVLRVGDELVVNSVGYRVEDVEIVTDLREYKDYDPEAWLSFYADDFVNDDGSFITIAESNHGLPDSYYKDGYKNYAVFVKLSIHNYTSVKQNVYNGFSLFDSKDSLEGPDNPEYTGALKVNREEDAYKGIIQPNEKQVLVLGYTRSIRSDKNIYKTKLYISNYYDSNANQFDLNHGKGGFGKYLQIQ